jgi:hypothetical protein
MVEARWRCGAASRRRRGAPAPRVGQLYVAVVANEERVLAYLEIRLQAGFVGVHVDEQLRDRLAYLFSRDPTEDDLFLEQVDRNDYAENGTDELARTETYVFANDGSVKVEKAEFATRDVERYEVRNARVSEPGTRARVRALRVDHTRPDVAAAFRPKTGELSQRREHRHERGAVELDRRHERAAA